MSVIHKSTKNIPPKNTTLFLDPLFDPLFWPFLGVPLKTPFFPVRNRFEYFVKSILLPTNHLKRWSKTRSKRGSRKHPKNHHFWVIFGPF